MAMKTEVPERILWRDSKCVLQWIEGGSNQSVFVRNKIKEITDKQYINLHYINTSHKPADRPGRGISSKNLKDSQLWRHDPSWLSEDSQLWPMFTFPKFNLEKEYKETMEESNAVAFEMAGIS